MDLTDVFCRPHESGVNMEWLSVIDSSLLFSEWQEGHATCTG